MHVGELRGRIAEVTALDEELARVAAGRSGVVCVAGEPGIGKTSLLARLGGEAVARQMLVLEGRGAEFDRGVPFSAVVEALDDHVATLPRGTLRELRAADRTRLAVLFPPLDDSGGGPVPDSGSERHRTLAALRELLELLAAGRPVVLVLDDLHWVDDSSLELVLHLIRRRPRAPVLLALAYRPLALVQSAGAVRAAFIASQADALIEPGPLSHEQAAALIAGRVPTRRLDALVQASGGNPFYLEQLAIAQPSGAVSDDIALAGVPTAVARSLAGELAGLADPDRAVCVAAAVVGDPFEPALVAAAAGVPEAAALRSIDVLVRQGTVRQTAVARRFRFRHPIVRHAANESAAPGVRLEAHRRAAALLAAQGASPLERAHHVDASAVPGDSDAAAVLTAAARAASARAPAIAAQWYSAALRVMPSTADASARTVLLIALATAQGSAGMLEAGRRTLLEVLDTLPDELAALRGRILPFLALIGHMLGRHGEATALLRRALAEQPDPRSPESAELGIETAVDCLYEPDHVAMLSFATDANHAAEASGQPALAAAGAGALALAHYYNNELVPALGHFDRAVALTTSLTDGELSARLEGLLSMAWAAMHLERHADCIAISDRGIAISRATGQGHLLIPLGITRAVTLSWRGELAAASAEADELIDLARLSRVDQWIAWALTLRGWIATLTGDLDLASGCGAEACELAAGQARTTYFVAHAVLHRAETDLVQGRAAECRDDIVASAGGPGLPIVERPLRPRYYEILTRASLALGQLEEARRWADRALDAAEGSLIGGRRCEALLADAAVRLASEDRGGAEAAARAAREAAMETGDLLLAARAQVLTARACADRGREEAIALLEQARATFDSCRATRSRDEAVRELRRLGRRVGGGGRRGRGAHGASALSRREREVATLVTEGLTNREIAERLVLSDRTVETHLSSVFRKLGIRTRAGVASALERDP